MENRFGIKDFFLFALVSVVIVLVILAMKQVDRQWQHIQILEDQSRLHGQDLVAIRRTLAEGISVGTSGGTGPATTQSAQQGVDPFKPIKEAEKMNGFARGDWLVDNFGAKLKAVTPFIGVDICAAWVQAKVTEGLHYRDDDTLEFIPLLA